MKEKIFQLRKHPKTPAILTAIMFSGVSFAAVHNIPNPPIFPNTGNFVIFTERSINLEENATVSSGDIGANSNLEIGKYTTINGNLFADKIEIAKGTTINGNTTYNKLSNKGEILGMKTTHVSLPIANLPTIRPFTIGMQDKTYTGTANTLSSGNYKNITLQKDSTLTLNGGTYNLSALDLKEHSTLIFIAPTTLNIQFKLRGYDNVSILNGQNAKPQDLHINYIGTLSKQIKNEKQDDENEVMAFLDTQEKTDCKNQKIGRPIVFGKNSFLNFALFAPSANVVIGKDSTMRGQVLAKKARIGKNSIISKEEEFSRGTSNVKIITELGNIRYVSNQIMLDLTDDVTFSDAQNIADTVGGKIVGFISSVNAYQIEVTANTPEELTAKIQTLRISNNPFIEGEFRNYIMKLI